MSQRTVKILYIAIHGILALLLSGLALFIFLHQLIPTQFAFIGEVKAAPEVPYAGQTVLHIILSFVGMIPALSLPATSRNEIERALMPPMFLMMTLTNVSVIGFMTVLTTGGTIALTTIARIHLFAVLFATMLMLFMGLFHLGINTSKITQFSLLAAAGCLLIASLVPIAPALNPLDQRLWIIDRRFMILPSIIGVIAIFNYLALYLRERSQHILFRGVSISLIIAGHTLYTLRPGTVVVWLGIMLLTGGFIVGLPSGRFSQIQ
jgi:hypothetical protein